MSQPSIGQMVQRLSGLIGTKDVSDWEDDFLSDMLASTNCGSKTSHLSEKQVDIIEKLHRKHFA